MKLGIQKNVACRVYYPAAIILLLFQLVGCSLWRNITFNRKDSLVLKQEEKRIEMRVMSEQNEILHFTYSDSLKNSYWISIIPDGEFRFSPNTGFSGKALALEIKGNGRNWYSATASAEKSINVGFDSVSTTALKSREEMESKTKTAEKGLEKKPGWLTLIVLCLTLLVVVGKFGFFKRS